MSLLTTAQRALEELERLHPRAMCISPGNCPTKTTMDELRDAIAGEIIRNPRAVTSHLHRPPKADGYPAMTMTDRATGEIVRSEPVRR